MSECGFCSQPERKALFTRADHDRLRAALRNLHDVIPLCDSAEQCGIDVAHYRRLRDEMAKILGEIERHFMTPPPTE